MPLKGLVETTSTHIVRFKIEKNGKLDPKLRQILEEGLRSEGIVLPATVSFALKEESGWEDSDYVLEISWQT